MYETQLSLFETTEPEPNKHIQTLESILECLNNIPYINCGGCGISALAIYRWCKASGIEISDRPFVFLWRDGDEWEVSNNDSLLFEGEIDRVEAPCHIVIELHNEYYDSEGQGYEQDFIKQEYHLNEQELLNVINRTGEWNSMFRRAKNIGKIEFALGIDLSDVVKR